MNDIVPQDTITPQIVYIYTLSSPLTPHEIRYVGKANDPHKRLLQHVSDRSNTYRGHWLTSLRKQGLKPIMHIIEEVPFDLWAERELYWITYFHDQCHPLTNTYFGSEGTGIIPPETRAKLAAAHLGRKQSPEAIAKTTAAHMGRKNTPETLAKMSASALKRKTRTFSEEACRNISNNRRGKKHTPETKAKMSAKARRKRAPFSEEWKRNLGNARRGQKRSSETKAKISAANKGGKRTPEQRANMSLGRKRARAMRENPPNTSTLWD